MLKHSLRPAAVVNERESQGHRQVTACCHRS